MYFGGSMDGRTRLITAGALLLLLTIPGLLLTRPVFGSVVFIVAGLNALVCLVSFLWASTVSAACFYVCRGPSGVPSMNG